MDALWNDVRLAFRGLWRRPGFTLLSVVAFAFGTGLVTTMFSVLNSVLFKGLPFEDAENLLDVALYHTADDWYGEFTKEQLEAVREQQTTLDDLVNFRNWYVPIRVPGAVAERVPGLRVSTNLLEALRVSPALGRGFLDEDAAAGAENVVLISFDFWKRHFGDGENAIGAVVYLQKEPYRVIGVMPRGFRFPYPDTTYWVPYSPYWVDAENRTLYYDVFGRPKAEHTEESVLSEMRVIWQNLQKSDPKADKHMVVSVRPLTEAFIWTELSRRLLFLFSATIVVVLISCANVANLQLARYTTEVKDFAVRSALGAGRVHIVRRVMVESLAMAFLGALLGSLIVYFGTGYWKAVRENLYLPVWADFSIDFRVAAFVVAITALTGLLSGLVPAIRVSRPGINEFLKDDVRTASGLRVGRLSKLLVVVQVGLACSLLIALGLSLISVFNIRNQDLSVDTEKILIARSGWTDHLEMSFEELVARWNELQRALEAHTGIVSVAFARSAPTGSWGFQYKTYAVEEEAYEKGQYPGCGQSQVSPGYFQKLKIPILKGRGFEATDVLSSLPVAIVDDSFAKKAWPDEDPIGKRIKRMPGSKTRYGSESPWLTVVGVAPDLKPWGIANTKWPELAFYVPITQVPMPYNIILVRTTGNPLLAAPIIRSEMARLDSDAAVYRLRTLEEDRNRSIFQFLVTQRLLIVFGLAALVLASLGVYGVISFSVRQRTREIGIRMAFGADRGRILRLILREAGWQIACGLLLGVALAYIGTSYMEAFLFGIADTSPLTYIGVAVLLIAVSLVACLAPALRASSIHPVDALRYA